MKKIKQIAILEKDISFYQYKKDNFISLTDIAKHKNPEHPRYAIQNWMKTRYTVEFLGIWEQIHNPSFNRVEFGAFRNESGSNAFVLTPKKWINHTNSIGITSKAGRYGGTYAHKDIAFEFASWISAEFKLFLIKEFQRLKEQEYDREKLGWSAKRMLTKVNYRIHTDAIKKHIVPQLLNKKQVDFIYANEADILNTALFGMTAKEWKNKNPKLDGNMRDYANVTQLVCLANLESLNAEFIRQGIEQKERLVQLNKIAMVQMESLVGNSSVKKLSQ